MRNLFLQILPRLKKKQIAEAKRTYQCHSWIKPEGDMLVKQLFGKIFDAG